MQQNCQITRCVRQHTMVFVLKSTKPRRDLTGSRNVVAQARPVSPKLHELLGDKFPNCISNNSDSDIFDTIEIQNRNRVNSRIDLWTVFVPRNIPCIVAVSFFGWVEASVTWHTGLSQWRPLFVDSRRLIARSQNRSRMCEIRLTKLPCAAQRVGIAYFYAVTEIKGLSCRLRWIHEWRNLLTLTKLPCAAQQMGIAYFYAVTEIKGLSCRLRWIRERRNLLTSTHVGYRVSHGGSRECRVTKIWGPRGKRD